MMQLSLVFSSRLPRLAGFVSVALLVAGVALSTPARAQMGTDTTQVTFNEAIRIALDQNTDLKRASNVVRRADANVWAERLDWAPTADLSTVGRRRFGRSFSQQEGEIVNQSIDELFGSVDAGVTFQGLGVHNYASMRQAELESAASQLTLGRTRQDVVFQVMDRYISLVENREILRVQREELDARQQQLRQIEEFVDAGSRPVSALYEQQAAVAEQESAVLQAERDVQLTETRLIQTLRLDPFTPYRFEAPSVERDTLVGGDTYDLDRLMQDAFDRRLDLRSARSSVQAAERGVRVAKSEYLPTLSLAGSYSTSWSSNISDIQRITSQESVTVLTENGGTAPYRYDVITDVNQLSFLDKLDQRRGGNLSISLSFPIFDGMRRDQRIEEAQVSVQNARYDLEDQKLQIALEVREAYLNYRNAEQQLDATAKRLRAARQARQAAQERYNLGAASIVELTNANRTFVEAASQRIRARYSFVFQQKLIDYYVGTLNPQVELFE